MSAEPALSSRLDALTALANEPSSTRRRDLLREVTDVFFAPTPPPAGALDLFEAALDRMTGVMEAELRADLAERLAPLAAPPRRLVARLIADEDGAVAAPMLERSRALTADDLMGAVSTGGQMHLRAVSRRDDLTETISDRIVERGDDTTLAVLVSNAAAPLSRAASEAVVERALVNPDLHGAVVGRESLPVDLLNEMYLVCETRLRERIMARNAALPPEVLEAALRASRVRVATQTGALPPDYAAATAYVERLVAEAPVAAATILAFLRGGQRTHFLAALSHASSVDFATVQRVVERKDGEAFALLCRAAGYGVDLFRDVLALLKLADERMQGELRRRFGTLTAEAAIRVVRFWNVRVQAGGLSASGVSGPVSRVA